ncbi:hypothetical protein FGG08_003472 [Glutinoglossum americanum]|uniref:AAA+ ATPase domain-containing protein n=1 Tax=Glutinoglossum americanum TaxID=1670608 RepID=A0A9P8I774_9PEZI|nr:hypothetical protein FGG08_003472 [Glutinoglossum americanum]
MRNKQSSLLQKTYDECYLICSTAIYFEGQVRKSLGARNAVSPELFVLPRLTPTLQSNEAEALRSWRNALDQIYYFNAYRVPPNYRPKSETEKALQDSLREMELQCKERVDLLEALRLSRIDSKPGAESSSSRLSIGKTTFIPTPRASLDQEQGAIGEGSVPAFDYPDLSRPAPTLPQRPASLAKKSSGSDVPRLQSSAQANGLGSRLHSPPLLPVPQKKVSRAPSPEKKGLLTTLRTGRDGKRASQVPRHIGQRRESGIAAAKAASQAWGSISKTAGERLGQSLGDGGGSSATANSTRRESYGGSPDGRAEYAGRIGYGYEAGPAYPDGGNGGFPRPTSPSANSSPSGAEDRAPRPYGFPFPDSGQNLPGEETTLQPQTMEDLISLDPLAGPQQGFTEKPSTTSKSNNRSSPRQFNVRTSCQFLGPANKQKRLPPTPITEHPLQSDSTNHARLPLRSQPPPNNSYPAEPSRSIPRTKRHPNSSSPCHNPHHRQGSISVSSDSDDESANYSPYRNSKSRHTPRRKSEDPIPAESPSIPASLSAGPPTSPTTKDWDDRIEHLMKSLPKGVDEAAAKQIFNEIVVKGDEVHWDDVAGLDAAKLALKEAVVYPFLRPDLFMGLREPARGMLLFGPPGTGKTMLARAVATESKSTFFSISASSLTSKYLGESEKLVRALFQLAKALAPSIIFVDEIDSLLSSRSGSGEHEATRRIKTEFLIQWSDLQRAAAGREQSTAEKEKGDASRVLVLAATNLPWAIDEAARRRFVRRQYIPLPEGSTRAAQLRTLLGHQKHELGNEDIERLVDLTEGKFQRMSDAAMGPLRSLGEALLHMSMDQIRPIQFQDFEASLTNIRPSVSKQGLKEFENWAKEFGERGG